MGVIRDQNPIVTNCVYKNVHVCTCMYIVHMYIVHMYILKQYPLCRWVGGSWDRSPFVVRDSKGSLPLYIIVANFLREILAKLGGAAGCQLCLHIRIYTLYIHIHLAFFVREFSIL